MRQKLWSISRRRPTNIWAVVVGYNSDSSPAIAPDGTIYCGSWSGKFFAVSPTGEVKWIFQTKTEIKSSPAIATDGTIYFGCRNKSYMRCRRTEN